MYVEHNVHNWNTEQAMWRNIHNATEMDMVLIKCDYLRHLQVKVIIDTFPNASK